MARCHALNFLELPENFGQSVLTSVDLLSARAVERFENVSFNSVIICTWKFSDEVLAPVDKGVGTGGEVELESTGDGLDTGVITSRDGRLGEDVF